MARLSAGKIDYKDSRDLVHNGRCWCGEAADGISWLAFGDPTDLKVKVIRTSPQTFRFAPQLQLPMLMADQLYSVQPEGHPAFSQYGDWLVKSGISLPPMQSEDILWVRLRLA